jgi:hypothetical protein
MADEAHQPLTPDHNAREASIMAGENLSEEWRSVEGWPYKVSSIGRVRRAAIGKIRGSRNGYILAEYPDDAGYLCVTLNQGNASKTFRIHVLVCAAFHGPSPSPDYEVAHWDGDRSNNLPSNLRWATRSANAIDSIRHRTKPLGVKHHWTVIDESTAREIKALLNAGDKSPYRIAKLFGISAGVVHGIKQGRSWAWLD